MDYGVKLEKVPLYCDNTSAINPTKNHNTLKPNILKSCIISLEIMFKKVIVKLSFSKLKNQLVDLFTKPLVRDKFNKLKTALGVLDMKNVI